MARTSIRRIRTFIGMYDKQGEIGISEADGKYVVVNHFDTDDEITYVCNTLTDAGGLVNRIIFKMPIEATVVYSSDSDQERFQENSENPKIDHR